STLLAVYYLTEGMRKPRAGASAPGPGYDVGGVTHAAAYPPHPPPPGPGGRRRTPHPAHEHRPAGARPPDPAGRRLPRRGRPGAGRRLGPAYPPRPPGSGGPPGGARAAVGTAAVRRRRVRLRPRVGHARLPRAEPPVAGHAHRDRGGRAADWG